MFAPLNQGGIVYSNKWDVIVFAWFNDAIGDYLADLRLQRVPAERAKRHPLVQPARAGGDDGALRTLPTAAAKRRRRDRAERAGARRPDDRHRIAEDIYAYNCDLKNFHPNALTPFDNMMDVDI